MRVVAVVQARLGSSRLPGKVLLDLAGKPALLWCLARAQRIGRVDDIVVAVPERDAEIIGRVARRVGVRVLAGPEDDVLRRYALVAAQTKADAVVRVTSDCPLLDPNESSRVVEAFCEGGLDYASNTLERTLPRGLDTEVLSTDALFRADRDATDPMEREHVTLHVYRRPEMFRLRSVVTTATRNLSHVRVTLDTLDDYRVICALAERLGAEATFDDIACAFENDPELFAQNAHIVQRT